MSALGGGMRWYEGENRAIAIALLVSVALHVLLLFAWPNLRESQRRNIAREPLVARILQPRAQPAAALIPAIPETRIPVHPPAAKPLPRARGVPEPALTLRAAQVASAAPDVSKGEPAIAAPATSVAVASSEAPVAGTPSAVPVAAPTPAAPPFAARGVPQSTAAAEQASDAGTLAQYRLAIISAARRYKRYPREALDNNWQGRVEVHMVIGANGTISTLSVRTSAGHSVLDQQAIEMIERARSVAQIPPALRGREFVVDIPVIFSLREPDA